jgi:glycosyltransferase involved in cell wall biosynthesis
MKKILIIGMSLNVGGAEKSLVNLLNLMDKEKYSVDLLLFQDQGTFLRQIPDWINKIEVHEISILYQSLKETLAGTGVSFKDILLSAKRYLYTAIERYKWKQFDRVRLHRWIDYYSKLIPLNNKEYDVGIAYAGGETTYYLVDKVKCHRTVCFFHSDYSKIDIDEELEEKYVEKVEQIITISDACKVSLQNLFPKQKEKVRVLQNLSSPSLINKLSNEFYPKEYKELGGKKLIVSVGRLNRIKGYDMAIKAAKHLKDQGIRFSWYVVGEGEERKNLQKDIRKYQLEKEFILLGLRENPYPYIRHADILVQPSRFEGKSVVLDEAKILKKPIVVTNYNSVEDQIDNEKTGIISKMTSEDLAEKIKILLIDNEKQKKIIENLNNMFDISITEIGDYCQVLVGE